MPQFSLAFTIWSFLQPPHCRLRSVWCAKIYVGLIQCFVCLSLASIYSIVIKDTCYAWGKYSISGYFGLLAELQARTSRSCRFCCFYFIHIAGILKTIHFTEHKSFETGSPIKYSIRWSFRIQPESKCSFYRALDLFWPWKSEEYTWDKTSVL